MRQQKEKMPKAETDDTPPPGRRVADAETRSCSSDDVEVAKLDGE